VNQPQVAVVLDVEHVAPWTPYMSDLMPEGSLVVVRGQTSAGTFCVCDSEDERWTWFVHPSSLEILGDL
jgi:hypothetical protein